MKNLLFVILVLSILLSCSGNKNLEVLTKQNFPGLYEYPQKDTLALHQGSNGKLIIDSNIDGIRRTQLFFTSKGILEMSFKYDSTGNGIEGATVFHPNGAVKHQISLKGSVLDGETWSFSKEGTLVGVYLYRNGSMKKVLFNNPNFEPVDSSFIPILIIRREIISH